MLSDYENDITMFEYCNNNKNDIKCQCLIINDNIDVFSKSSYAPYFCWYSPCRNNENYITSLIKSEQKYCNITVCEISVNDIILSDNGNITITNDCARNINPIYSLSQTIVSLTSFDVPNLLVNFFYPVVIIISILIFFKN
ncbi:putative late 16kDa membrane protein (Cop-J5L) [Choristoneura biennis entomopoxvirus]|uniref:Late 16kDa membrane protein (Cop-J5L) n=1 Tax=Choristoneura biennis entomopoxvirus TaxID=10288 RepID=A0A916KPV1_CBEPV|nr:putative late 16kDa membrane protein (Cop-J5L) [Choristoneura biennis entomopoxvirus]CCU55836.1 putative late 16kDa membrane protein (Cop-J5L) [Choristoneura biennis entomopoxvirus]